MQTFVVYFMLCNNQSDLFHVENGNSEYYVKYQVHCFGKALSNITVLISLLSKAIIGLSIRFEVGIDILKVVGYGHRRLPPPPPTGEGSGKALGSKMN